MDEDDLGIPAGKYSRIEDMNNAQNKVSNNKKKKEY